MICARNRFIAFLMIALFVILQPGIGLANGGYSSFPKERIKTPITQAGYTATPEEPKERQSSSYYQEVQPLFTLPEVFAGIEWAWATIWGAMKAVVMWIWNTIFAGFLVPLVTLTLFPLIQFLTGSEVAGIGMVEDNVSKAMKVNDNWNALKRNIGKDANNSREMKRNIQKKEMELEQEKAALHSSDAMRACTNNSNIINLLSGYASMNASLGGGGGVGSTFDDLGPLAEITARANCVIAYIGEGDYNNSTDAILDSPKMQECIEKVNQVYGPVGGGPLLRNECNRNCDADFNCAFEQVLTQGEREFTRQTSEGETVSCGPSNYTTDNYTQQALMDNLFRSDAVTPPSKADVEDMTDENGLIEDADLKEFLLAKRTLDAYSSVSKNAFQHWTARSEPSGGDTENTLFGEIGEFFGINLNNCDDAFCSTLKQIQNSPSYRAQLKGLAKLLYLNPGYMATVSEEGNEQNMVLATAIENMVMYDALQSAMRQEAILATMVEVMLEDKHQQVEDLSSRIRGRN